MRSQGEKGGGKKGEEIQEMPVNVEELVLLGGGKNAPGRSKKKDGNGEKGEKEQKIRGNRYKF